MKKVVIFGGGNIGRGLVGRIFCEADYEVVFVDVNQDLITRLNSTNSYPLYVTNGSDYDKREVVNVSAVDGRDMDAIIEQVDQASICATAIGVNVLPIIAKTIANVIRHRFESGNTEVLNFILCENKIDSHLYMRDLLRDLLDEKEYEYCEKYIGFCQCSIGCMVPAPPKELVEKDPLIVCVEDYNKIYADKSGARGILPEIKNIIAYEPFAYYINRKLFMHNMSHALVSYLGYLKGYKFIWQAVEDPEILSTATKALAEAGEALSKFYGEDIRELNAHSEDLLNRYKNRLLGDTIARVGADPIRKLSPSDRLCGAALFCLKNGVEPNNIAIGIAAGYLFSSNDDKSAVEIQEFVAKEGIESAIEKYSSVKRDDPLYVYIKKALQTLTA
ncbi:MAG: hypothetical protein IJO74_05960 [Clostridia bacterium]|nr:hypothetical protein [Clostridia bacterium]